jgi:hypothetical protein
VIRPSPTTSAWRIPARVSASASGTLKPSAIIAKIAQAKTGMCRKGFRYVAFVGDCRDNRRRRDAQKGGQGESNRDLALRRCTCGKPHRDWAGAGRSAKTTLAMIARSKAMSARDSPIGGRAWFMPALALAFILTGSRADAPTCRAPRGACVGLIKISSMVRLIERKCSLLNGKKPDH